MEPVSKLSMPGELKLAINEGKTPFLEGSNASNVALTNTLRSLILLGQVLRNNFLGVDAYLRLSPESAGYANTEIQQLIAGGLRGASQQDMLTALRSAIAKAIIRATPNANGGLPTPIEFASDSGETFVLRQDGEQLKLKSKQSPEAKIEIGPIKSFAEFQNSLRDELLRAAEAKSTEKAVIVATEGNENQSQNTLFQNDRVVPNNLALLGRRFQEKSKNNAANRHQAGLARISLEPVRSISPIRKTRSNLMVYIVILLTALMFCGALIISLAFVL